MPKRGRHRWNGEVEVLAGGGDGDTAAGLAAQAGKITIHTDGGSDLRPGAWWYAPGAALMPTKSEYRWRGWGRF